MSEIDLIPVGYARLRRTRDWILRSAVVYVIFFVAFIVGRLALDYSNTAYGAEIAAIEIERDRARQEQDEMEALIGERRRLSDRLEVLRGIRGDGIATEMFRVVDSSLDENVWFHDWTFSRADEIVAEEDRAVQTGFFIVLPKEHSDEPERAWRRQTHMEISAEAEDHHALAGFVRRLAKNPLIEQARIIHTTRQMAAGEEGIQFEVAVTLRGPE